ncbi:hypothetical protein ABW21_db0202064 [Orbilia brochopaga]|nr:hypothetical protein ABW21_db0202064 [Drechslerella brochopaga]
MPNKHYLSDSDTAPSFPQKRHVSAPTRYTPVQAPRTPLYSPISPSREEMDIDKVEPAPSDDSFEAGALLTPQETKRSTASPPAVFHASKQPRPSSLDGRLAELSRAAATGIMGMDADVDMGDDESEDSDAELIGRNAGDLSNPIAIMNRYFTQAELNPDVIVLKATIEMLRKRKAQCQDNLATLEHLKNKALAHPDRFSERVIAASQGAQKTNIHQGKHHWRLEDNNWEIPAALEIPRVPTFDWIRRYGVPPIYKNQDVALQSQTPAPMQQPSTPSATVQDMINPTRMTTRNNSARSAGATRPSGAQQFNIRTGLDMANRQKKNNPLMSYTSPYNMSEFNSPVQQCSPLGMIAS